MTIIVATCKNGHSAEEPKSFWYGSRLVGDRCHRCGSAWVTIEEVED
jgi:hypothetical protein